MHAPDHRAAMWWYSKAATAGIAKGAHNLGYMYERGLGAPQSWSRAERHYRKAAELSGGDWSGKVVLYASMALLRVRRLCSSLGFDLPAYI